VCMKCRTPSSNINSIDRRPGSRMKGSEFPSNSKRRGWFLHSVVFLSNPGMCFGRNPASNTAFHEIPSGKRSKGGAASATNPGLDQINSRQPKSYAKVFMAYPDHPSTGSESPAPLSKTKRSAGHPAAREPTLGRTFVTPALNSMCRGFPPALMP
jgi:hypothetical protein